MNIFKIKETARLFECTFGWSLPLDIIYIFTSIYFLRTISSSGGKTHYYSLLKLIKICKTAKPFNHYSLLSHADLFSPGWWYNHIQYVFNISHLDNLFIYLLMVTHKTGTRELLKPESVCSCQWDRAKTLPKHYKNKNRIVFTLCSLFKITYLQLKQGQFFASAL